MLWEVQFPGVGYPGHLSPAAVKLGGWCLFAYWQRLRVVPESPTRGRILLAAAHVLPSPATSLPQSVDGVQ